MNTILAWIAMLGLTIAIIGRQWTEEGQIFQLLQKVEHAMQPRYSHMPMFEPTIQLFCKVLPIIDSLICAIIDTFGARFATWSHN